MNSSKTRKHYTDTLITLVVYVVFAACIILTLLAGAGVYRRINARDDSAYSMRTVSQYISTRVRGAQSPDSVRVEKFGDGDALCIGENISGEEYFTYIYLHGGFMKELYASEKGSIRPEYGEKLLEADTLELSLENGLLRVRTAAAGEDGTEFCLNIRGREGRQ